MANENNVRFSLAAVMVHSSFAQTLRRKLHFPCLCSGNFTLEHHLFYFCASKPIYFTLNQVK